MRMNNDLFSESWPYRGPVKFIAEAIKDISNKLDSIEMKADEVYEKVKKKKKDKKKKKKIN